MRPGGQIVLSGVLARQAEEVIATYSQWLTLSVWKESEGWVCLHGTLNADSKSSISGQAQKKSSKLSLKAILLGLFFLLLVAFGEHISRNSLLPILAPRVDGTSNAVAVTTFSLLQQFDEKLCRSLGCINRPVSDFAAWKIISANLALENSPEALKTPANQSTLQVEIQNRLAINILWPYLEISLTDADESELKSIQFSPKQWLPANWQESHPDFLREGAPAGEIIHSDLPIALSQNAAGYRVRVFYPQSTTPSPHLTNGN